MTEFHQGIISFERVMEIQEEDPPHRICFATCHRNALKTSSHPDYVGTFNVPFAETIGPIFEEETGLQLYVSRSSYTGYWHSVHSCQDFETIENFLKQAGPLVFLRDALALSIAVSELLAEDGSRTPVGALEYAAKYQGDESAVTELANRCIEVCNQLPYYRDAAVFCAVPPSNEGEPNLPAEIVDLIREKRSMNNISDAVRWANPKNSLKDVPIEDKWDALAEADLVVEENLTGKAIVLLDDLYQSGFTMQYVAMALQQAGASHILGLALVKSRSDTDNQ